MNCSKRLTREMMGDEILEAERDGVAMGILLAGPVYRGVQVSDRGRLEAWREVDLYVRRYRDR